MYKLNRQRAPKFFEKIAKTPKKIFPEGFKFELIKNNQLYPI